MAITNSGMTLYADHDSQETWVGTDDLDDYNMSIQGTNSESWIVSKNATETGVMTLSANMGTSKYFTMWMKSDLDNYYTSITVELEDTAADSELFTIADSTDRDVTGEFHSSCMQFGQGTSTGTLDRTIIDTLNVEVNNSTSGNIRSVTNNWMDTMHYGDGRIIAGTTASDELFLESHVADTATSDEYDGCSELFPSGLAFQTDIIINTSTGNSYGETISFVYSRNTDNIYTVDVTGTAAFKGTVLIGQDGAIVGFDSTASTSFSWVGGGITNGGDIKFKSGETNSGLVLTACNEVDTNGATLSGTTITDTTETTTGSLLVNSSTEGNAITDMQFKSYAANSRYAVYVAAGVTAFTMDNWQFDDPNNTVDYAVYWAGVAGTLTISSTNGTNLLTSGCTSAGGTIAINQDVTVQVTSIVTGSVARVSTVDANGDESTNLINETVSGTTASTSTNYAGLDYTDVVIIVRNSSSDPRYIPYRASGVITSNGMNVPANQVIDTIAERITEPLEMTDGLIMVDDLEMT